MTFDNKKKLFLALALTILALALLGGVLWHNSAYTPAYDTFGVLWHNSASVECAVLWHQSVDPGPVDVAAASWNDLIDPNVLWHS